MVARFCQAGVGETAPSGNFSVFSDSYGHCGCRRPVSDHH